MCTSYDTAFHCKVNVYIVTATVVDGKISFNVRAAYDVCKFNWRDTNVLYFHTVIGAALCRFTRQCVEYFRYV